MTAACEHCGTIDVRGPHTQGNCIGVLRAKIAATAADAGDREAQNVDLINVALARAEAAEREVARLLAHGVP